MGKFLFSYIPLFAGLALSVALMVALRKHAKATANLQEVKDDSKARQARQAERQLAMTIWVRHVSSRPNNYSDCHPEMFLCKARTSSIKIDHLGTSPSRPNSNNEYHHDMFLCKARTSSIKIDHLGTSPNRPNNYSDYHHMFLCI